MARPDLTPGVRPRATLVGRLDAAARAAFPTACTLVLMSATAVPFGFAGQAMLLPAVAVTCVYVWSLVRPAAMPATVVFMLGVLLDLLGYLPLGVGALTLLAVHALALRFRAPLTRIGLLRAWPAFACFAVGAGALGWGLTAVLSFRLLPAWPALLQALLTVALYPALAIAFSRAHHSLVGPEQA